MQNKYNNEMIDLFGQKLKKNDCVILSLYTTPNPTENDKNPTRTNVLLVGKIADVLPNGKLRVIPFDPKHQKKRKILICHSDCQLIKLDISDEDLAYLTLTDYPENLACVGLQVKSSN